MRELVAYSKQITLSRRERARFEAQLADKKLELSEETPSIDPSMRAKMKAIAEASARKKGVIK